MSKIKWLVMIYLAGDNNLSEECVYALTEMKKIGSSKDVAIFAQLDTGIHDNTPLFIKQSLKPGQTKDELNDVRDKRAKLKLRKGKGKEKDLTYSEVIFNFVKECVDQYDEIEHTMFVLNGHASGIVENFLAKVDADKIDSLSVLSLYELVERIKNELLGGKSIDILGLDTCLMSMGEVAYLVRNSAKVMIGAEGFEPLGGWPYASVLSSVTEFAKKNDAAIKPLAKKIVCDYIDFYSDYQAAGVSVDQSACDLGQCNTLMQAVKSLSQVLQPYLKQKTPDKEVRNALILAHWEAQPYKNEQYVDLYDFCERLRNYCPASR